MTYHASNELQDFWRQCVARRPVPKFCAQALPLQRLTPIRVRWTPLRLVPRRVAPVADRLLRLPPCPQLDQRVRPGADVEGPHVRPDVPQLLLAQALDLLQVVEVLLDAEPIRGRTQDLFGRQAHVRAEQPQPAVLL